MYCLYRRGGGLEEQKKREKRWETMLFSVKNRRNGALWC